MVEKTEDRKESLEINIDGLSSLKTLHLSLHPDQSISTTFLERLHSIEDISLCGSFSYLNFDHLLNLKCLSLEGTLSEGFNFDFLKNLCTQLESLEVSFTNIDDKTFFKLFDDHHFPNLVRIDITDCDIKIVKKSFMDKFPMVQYLNMNECSLECSQ